MSLHIQRFVDRLRGAEARGTRDFTMSMQDAKDLHADITRLLLHLADLQEHRSAAEKDQVITVQVGGGSF